MGEIEELDISKLKNKGKLKKIKIITKKMILGVLFTSMTISLIPNVEYQVALQSAKSDPFIQEQLSPGDIQEENLKAIFEKAINENENIDDEDKKRIISAFEEVIIDGNAYLFTEDSVYNMYAVAKTERVKEMTKFAKEHGWWSGDYFSYVNIYTLYDSVEETDMYTIAHEQLHAILKKGILDTGFTKAIIFGYGVNEGATAFLGKDDGSYLELQHLISTLGIILGYDKVLSYFVNRDLDGLKKEINQYLSPKDTNKLIGNMDIMVYTLYISRFLGNHGLSKKEEEFEKYYDEKLLETQKILLTIYEKKSGMSAKDSDFGRYLFDSYYDNSSEEEDIHKTYYGFKYNDEESVLFDISNYFDGLFLQNVDNINIENFGPESQEKISEEIANELGAEKVIINSISKEEDGTYVRVSSVYFKIPTKEVETYDYNELLNRIKNKNSIDKSPKV